MGSYKSFSSLILSKKPISQKQMIEFFEILKKYEFEGYDYNSRRKVDLNVFLENSLNDFQYGLLYKNDDFALSNTINENYVGYTMDNSAEASRIFVNLTNDFCKSLKEISFSYVDDGGSSPKDIESYIKRLEFKWLFKYNYFGKEYLEKYGEDFFLNIPSVSSEFITQDIIRVDLSKDILSPVDVETQKNVSKYLSQFSIKVRYYNQKNFFID